MSENKKLDQLKKETEPLGPPTWLKFRRDTLRGPLDPHPLFPGKTAKLVGRRVEQDENN